MSSSEASKKWGDDENEDAFDRKTETAVDAQGIKIVTEFRTNERGQRVRKRISHLPSSLPLRIFSPAMSPAFSRAHVRSLLLSLIVSM